MPDAAAMTEPLPDPILEALERVEMKLDNRLLGLRSLVAAVGGGSGGGGGGGRGGGAGARGGDGGSGGVNAQVYVSAGPPAELLDWLSRVRPDGDSFDPTWDDDRKRAWWEALADWMYRSSTQVSGVVVGAVVAALLG